MKELTLHSNNVKKFILIHDTSGKYEKWEDYYIENLGEGHWKTSFEFGAETGFSGLYGTVGSGAITLVSTPSQNDNSSKVATTAYADRGDKNYVRNSTKYQPTCYVSDQVPDNNIGSDGDFWFQVST